MKRNLFYFSLLCIGGVLNATSKCTSHNTVLYRPFLSYNFIDGADLTYDVLYQRAQNHRMSFSVTPTFMQTFNRGCGASFATLPFWSGSNQMTIGRGDGKADIDGWNLGMGDVIVDENGIAGKISINPKVQQIGSDFALHYAYAKDKNSFFFDLRAPVVGMKVRHNLQENPVARPNEHNFIDQVTNPGGLAIELIDIFYPTPANRYSSASQYFLGGTPTCDLLDGSLNRMIALKYGKILSGTQTVVRVADIALTLGYQWISKSQNTTALGVIVTAPTGNTPTAQYMLEPVVGRAGAWAVGGQLQGCYNLWEHDYDQKNIFLNVQAQALHLIPGKKAQFRSFDLKQNGLGSKYMLLAHYLQDAIAFPSGAIDFDFFNKGFTPAINVTTLPVISKINFEGNISAQLQYVQDNWNVKLMGQVWGRSKERLKINHNAAVQLGLESLNNYAVAGRQLGHVAVNNQTTGVLYVTLCEPLATINTAQPAAPLSGASLPVGIPTVIPAGVADAMQSENRIPDNVSQALDICGAQSPSVITGNVTLNGGYIWSEKRFAPSLNLFGGVEISNNNSLPNWWHVGISGTLEF